MLKVIFILLGFSLVFLVQDTSAQRAFSPLCDPLPPTPTNVVFAIDRRVDANTMARFEDFQLVLGQGLTAYVDQSASVRNQIASIQFTNTVNTVYFVTTSIDTAQQSAYAASTSASAASVYENLFDTVLGTNNYINWATSTSRKVMIVLAANNPTDGSFDDVLRASRDFKRAGGIVYIVTVGTQVDVSLMREIVSAPTGRHLLPVKHIDDLPLLAQHFLAEWRGDIGFECVAFGEPHFLTFDGVGYSFEGRGEFWLVKSSRDSFGVQARQLACTQSRDANVACLESFALSDGVDRVELHYDARYGYLQVRINGENRPTQAVHDDALSGRSTLRVRTLLDGSLRVEVRLALLNSATFLFRKTGSIAHVRPASSSFDRVGGLCGTMNACLNDEFLLPADDGASQVLNSTERRAKLNVDNFASEWRVSGDESLFDHMPNEAYDTAATVEFDKKKAITRFDDVLTQADDEQTEVADLCTSMPDGFLRKACQLDSVSGSATDFLRTTEHVRWHLCRYACASNVMPVPAFDIELCGCANRNSTGNELDLHANYNSSRLPPAELLLDSQQGALFRGALRGIYTFELEATFCEPVKREIRQEVTCKNGLQVSAGTAVTSGSTELGYNVVRMSGSGPDLSTLRALSWTFVKLPENVATAPALVAANSYEPEWEPTGSGTYTLELAAYDGCQIAKSTVDVVVQCLKCKSDVVINPGNDGLPTLLYDGTGWPTVTVRTSAVSQQLTYNWSVVATPFDELDNFVMDIDWTLGEFDFYTEAPKVQVGESVVELGDLVVGTETETANNDDLTPPISHPTHSHIVSYQAIYYDSTYEQCNDTTTTNTTVFEESDGRVDYCQLVFGTPDGDQTTLTVVETNPEAFVAAKCVGTYRIRMTAENGCNKLDDEVMLNVQCDTPPVPLISCSAFGDAAIPYPYGSLAFDAVEFDARHSFDRESTIDYQWTIVSQPEQASSTVSCESCAQMDVVPTWEGTYVVQLLVTDGCSVRGKNITFRTDCTAPPTSSFTTPPTSGMHTGIMATGITFAADGVSGSGDMGDPILEFTWNVLPPSGRDVLVDVGIVNAAIASFPVTTSGSTTTTVNNVKLDFPGTWTVVLTTHDGCMAANNTFPLGYTCDSTLVAKVDFAEPSTTVELATLTTLDFDMSNSTLAAGTYDPTLVDTYSLVVTLPNGETDQWLNAVSPLFSYSPPSAFETGTYDFTFYLYDGCNHDSVSMQIEVVDTMVATTTPMPCTDDVTGALSAVAASVTSAWDGGAFTEVEVAGQVGTAMFDYAGPTILSYEWTFISSPEQSMFLAIKQSDAVVETAGTPMLSGSSNATHQIEETTAQICRTRREARAVLTAPCSAGAPPLSGRFIPDAAGTYVLELTVVTACQVEKTTVTVTAACPAEPSGVAAAAGGAFNKTGFERIVLSADFISSSGADLQYQWGLVEAPEGSSFFAQLFPPLDNSTGDLESEFVDMADAFMGTTTFPVQVNGSDPRSLITNGQSATASFVPDAPGTYVFWVLVTDACSVVQEEVSVTVACGAGAVTGDSLLLQADAADFVIDSEYGMQARLFVQNECAQTYKWSLASYEFVEAQAPVANIEEDLIMGMSVGAFAALWTILILCCIIIVIVIVVVVMRRRGGGGGGGGGNYVAPAVPISPPVSQGAVGTLGRNRDSGLYTNAGGDQLESGDIPMNPVGAGSYE